MTRVHTFRLVGPSGSNKVMAGELSRLCRRALSGRRLTKPTKAGTGALVYEFDAEFAAVAAHYHRTCSRVLWDLYSSTATRLEPLYDQLRADVASDDRAHLFDGATISVGARNVGTFAAGERQVVGAVKNAIVDGAAARGMSLTVSPDSPDILLAARMHDDVVTVSIDLAGKPMHRRGYREQAGQAPLRENVAAALVMLARHDARSEIIVDPTCGSGTILIEAALMASGTPVHGELAPLKVLRAFDDVSLGGDALFSDTVATCIGVEIDRPTAGIARNNAALAGVSSSVSIIESDFCDVTRAEIDDIAKRAGRGGPGLLLCNPPYGERIGGDVESLYGDLRGFCSMFRGWRIGILVENPAFEAAFGGSPRIKKPMSNGPMRPYFYLYDL